MLGRSRAARAVQTEIVETLPKKGALCPQWKRCGQAGCRCARGQLHGPYWCIFWRERGRLRKRYVRLAEVEAARAELRGRAEQRWLRRLAAKESRSMWREQTARLREYERWLRR
jgi:hypothetical protein